MCLLTPAAYHTDRTRKAAGYQPSRNEPQGVAREGGAEGSGKRAHEPMSKNRMRGGLSQDELVNDRHVLATKGRGRRSGGCARRARVLYLGDSRLALRGRRHGGAETSAAAIDGPVPAVRCIDNLSSDGPVPALKANKAEANVCSRLVLCFWRIAHGALRLALCDPLPPQLFNHLLRHRSLLKFRIEK
jgi:hypothetical protein